MIPRKYIEALVIAISCILAIIVGSHVVTFSIPQLSIATALAFTLIWIFTAGDYWWAPVLTGATVSGAFFFGFKMYPLDVALVLAVLGLLPLFLIQHQRLFQAQRKPLPLLFYIVAAYITIRLMIVIIPASGARGSMGRIYVEGIWPFIFAWLFHHYGKLSAMRWALGVAFTFLTLRAALAIIGFIANLPLYIPGVNYVLSYTGEENLVPMRAVAFYLLLLALILFHASRSMWSKIFTSTYFPFAAALVVLGAARFNTLMMMVLPIAFFVWSRRLLLLLVFFSLAAGSVAVINFNPLVIDEFPLTARRALSGLIIGSPTQLSIVGLKQGTEGSDIWHSLLRTEAYNRWTSSPAHFLFGYGVRPSPEFYDPKQYSVDIMEVISTSANAGSYESGFWSMVAVYGLVGLVLYTLLFLQLGWQVLPYFFQKPTGTIWEGLVFWGCYGVLSWYVTSNYQGSYPSLELVMMVIAVDIVQDGKIKLRREEEKPERLARQAFGLPITRPAGHSG